MISKKLCKAINKQINAEMYSSYLYLSMSSWFEGKSLAGFASWMRVQAEEEMFHAMKMYDYVHERGNRVVLETIEKPASEWESPLAVVKNVLKHEELVTGLHFSLPPLMGQLPQCFPFFLNFPQHFFLIFLSLPINATYYLTYMIRKCSPQLFAAITSFEGLHKFPTLSYLDRAIITFVMTIKVLYSFSHSSPLFLSTQGIGM